MAAITFEEWLISVFDNPERVDPCDPRDYESLWREDDDPRTAIRWMTRLFQESGDLLHPYSNAQINSGLWFLVSNACSSHTHALFNFDFDRQGIIPLAERIACVRAIGDLYRQVFLPRCDRAFLSHLQRSMEPEHNPLNAICYMWWDLTVLPYGGDAQAMAALWDEIFALLAGALTLNSAACRESALHGLGHLVSGFPERVAAIIDPFLEQYPALDPALITYARSARGGCVL